VSGLDPAPAGGAPVVLVTARSFSSGDIDAEARLTGAGLEVVRGDAAHDLDALRPHLERASAWVAGAKAVTAEHLAAAPHLRVLSRYGVGVDAVDLEAAAQRGVVVTNTPGANSQAVAEHALALLLTLLRHVVDGDAAVRAQDWSVTRTRQLASLTVGVLGFGRIGRALTAHLLALGCRVLAADPFVAADAVRAAGVHPVGVDEIAAAADVVSLHAPGEHLVVDAAWLATARPGLLLVNTARAALIDEQAVAAALRSEALAAYAGDDVGAGAGESASPLLAPDLAGCVVLTPHSAAQTVEAVDGMGVGAVENVLAVLGGREPVDPVRGAASPPPAEDRPQSTGENP
jgi:D-3-phosphoglycerate dehydrogenase